MKEPILYLLEALVCHGVLLGAYVLLLERRAAFRSCRTYLLLSTVAAAVIPLLRIPVWPGKVPTAVSAVTVGEWAIAAEILPDEAGMALGPGQIAGAIYLLGAALLLALTLRQFLRIRSLRHAARISRQEGFTLVRTPRKIASFSFFGSIYIWQGVADSDLPAILAHETSHIRHRHSYERLAMECLKMLLWWDPFIWLAARRLTEVEEFEADSDVLAGGYDTERYMHVLLQQLFGYNPEIANGLRNSLTKKRFEMMTTTSRSKYSLLRLAGTLPALLGLLCAFSFTARAAVPATSEPADEREISIRVMLKDADAASQEAGPGVLIKEVDGTRGSVTDAQGIARLRVPAGTELEAIYPDYCTSTFVTDQRDSYLVHLTSEREAAQPRTAPSEPGVREADERPLLIAEVMPKFQEGNLNDYRQWLQMRIRYPQEAIAKKIQGRVIASFVIEKDGSLTNIELLHSPDKLLSDEARRVLESTPAGSWSPGRHKGVPVRVKYTLPVEFRLQGAASAADTPAPKEKGTMDEIVVMGFGTSSRS